MGYEIKALISKSNVIPFLQGDFRPTNLPQNFILIPLVFAETELRQQFPFHEHGENEELRPGFGKPPPSLFTWLHEISMITPVAYIEAEYFGGYGSDFGILWRGGEACAEEPRLDINQCLHKLGVKKLAFDSEFNALGLGKCRTTACW